MLVVCGAAAVIVAVAGCGGSAGPTGGLAVTAPPEHHRPTETAFASPPPQRPTPRPAYPTPVSPGAPFPDATFQDVGVSGFIDTARDSQSTFAMDVDTASYTVARAYIREGRLPQRDSVRLEEYVNYFGQDYPAPASDAFAIHVDGGPTPFMSSTASTVLRVGVQARTTPFGERPDAHLTFVIDTSGSMQQDGRLELVKQALQMLVDELRPSDSVAIVAFSTEARVVLDPTSPKDAGAIREAIDSLVPDASTNAQAGLELGYELARQTFRRGSLDRVILASDGVANAGLTDAPSILDSISRDARAGIQLLTVGVGLGNFNDVLLEQLADRGDGFYAYIDDIGEARRLFVDDLLKTLDPVAVDAKVQVDFDPDVVRRYRLLGYEDRALPDQQFRDPSTDAGEIGAGHSVTALYEVELVDRTPKARLATVRIRWTDPGARDERHLSLDVIPADVASSFTATDARFQLATTVAAFAEVLRESPFARDLTLSRVADAAGHLPSLLRDDAQATEFVDLVREAARLAATRD
jgi:Ca-activated chloride channel family protein